MQIQTNNVPRPILYAYELSEQEQKEFDYIEFDDNCSATFFKYKGELYDLGEFMRIDHVMCLHSPEFKDWQGYLSDSYFSGIVVKYSEDCESIIIGQYSC